MGNLWLPHQADIGYALRGSKHFQLPAGSYAWITKHITKTHSVGPASGDLTRDDRSGANLETSRGGVYFPGSAATDSDVLTMPSISVGAGNFTFFIDFDLLDIAPAAPAGIYGVGCSSNSDPGWGIRVPGSNQLQMLVGNGTSRAAITTTASIGRHRFVGVVNRSGDLVYCDNGKEIGRTSITGLTGSYDNTNNPIIGLMSVLFDQAEFICYSAGWIPLALTDGEARTLSVDIGSQIQPANQSPYLISIPDAAPATGIAPQAYHHMRVNLGC